MNCSKPFPTEVLADYWLALLPQEEEDAIEEHLLSCDDCGERLREVMGLAQALRDLARQGSLRMVVSDSFLRRAAEDGLRVRQYAPPCGGSVQCTVTAEDDLLIGRLAANLSGAGRVDLCICDEKGVERDRLADIPVRPDASAVNLQESITFAKGLPDNTMIARLVTIDAAGSERLLGEYTFHHTRSMPGPGSWPTT